MSIFPEISLTALLLAVNVTLVGAVLALGVSASLRLEQSAHPRIRYVTAVSAFFLSIVLPVWMTFGLSERLKTQPALAAYESERGKVSQSGEQSLPMTELTNPTLTEPASVTALNSSHYFPVVVIPLRLAAGLLALWLTVSIALMAREVLGYARLVRRRREWRLADSQTLNNIEPHALPVPLYLSETEGPLAVGIFRQAIVFPARLISDLPAESIRSIALHELNHIHWHDPAVNAVLRLTRAFFWFSPMIWYLERVARLEREVAADFAAVISRRDQLEMKTAAGEYAKTLVLVAKWSAASIPDRGFGFAATEVGSRAGLENRVRRLFTLSENFARLRLACAASVLLSGIFCASVLALASQRLPVTLDADHITASDEPPLRAKTEPPQFNGPDFNEGNASETSPPISSSLSRTQLLREPDNNPHASALLPAETDTQAAPTDATFQLDENRPVESPDNKAGKTSLTAEQLELIRAYGVSDGYAAELAAAGYRNLPVDTLIEMKKFAVSAAFVREMASFGYGNLSSEELISFRRFGVSASYINEMRAAGYSLSTRMIIDYRREAVSTTYIREMRAAVAGDISSRQMLGLKRWGVSSGWIREINTLGFANLTADQLVSMRSQGVNVSFIQKMRERGYQNASIDELIRLRAGGVS